MTRATILLFTLCAATALPVLTRQAPNPWTNSEKPINDRIGTLLQFAGQRAASRDKGSGAENTATCRFRQAS